MLEAAQALFARDGYEATSTAAICRLAGTSQSQLMKHFCGKQGLLAAIFEHAWRQVNPAIRLAIEKLSAPAEKARTVMNMMLAFLEREPAVRKLLLLEGRRIRGRRRLVTVVPGYVEFVATLDGILRETAAHRQLRRGISPLALRSALIGAVEGMLRDKLIAQAAGSKAEFDEAEVRAVFQALLACSFSSERR